MTEAYRIRHLGEYHYHSAMILQVALNPPGTMKSLKLSTLFAGKRIVAITPMDMYVGMSDIRASGYRIQQSGGRDRDGSTIHIFHALEQVGVYKIPAHKQHIDIDTILDPQVANALSLAFFIEYEETHDNSNASNT